MERTAGVPEVLEMQEMRGEDTVFVHYALQSSTMQLKGVSLDA